MARYWVGGTASWDGTAGAKWATTSGGAGGATVPTTADDVFLDGASGAVTVTVATGNTGCLSLACTGFTGTLAGSAALIIAGSLTLVVGMTRTYVGALTFSSTSAGRTLTFAGKTMISATTFNGVGGGWTLQDAWDNADSNITLTAGTLDTNGQTVTTTGTFNISGSTARTLTLGASAINVGPWTATTTTNLTFNANTSTITMSSSGTFNGGGLTYNNVVLTSFTSNSETLPAIAGANTFANLTRTNTSGYVSLAFLADQTITGTFTVTGNNANTQRILVRSNVRGIATTITAAAVSLTNVDFEDITAAGAAAPFTGTSIGNCGGNTSITATTATTRYWVGGTGNWNATTEWATISGGASGASVPLPQDDVVFDANSFSAGSLTVSIGTTNFRLGKNINWTGVLNTPTWNFEQTSRIFGSLTLVSGMTLTGISDIVLRGRGSFNITSAGKSFDNRFDIDAPTGTYTLQDAFSIGTTRSLFVLRGTFNANNQNVTVGLFNSAGSSTRTITMGSGTWTITGNATNIWIIGAVGLTMTANTATIKLTGTLTAARTFSGGSLNFNGASYWNATTGAFAIVITGSNTFNDFKIDAGRIQHFTAGTTTTVTTFTAVGTAVDGITITSPTAANHTLSDTAGTNTVSYCTISRSTAQGGATWAASNGTNTDGGNNSGWQFILTTFIPQVIII